MLLLLAACHRTPDDPTADPIIPYDPLPLVDAFVGTGGAGFGIGSINPGARLPFGMVDVGPDTRGVAGDTEFMHCAGYAFGDDHIAAFSHNHAHGMGVADYGQIGLLPVAGWSAAITRDSSRAAAFDKASEIASPGFYGVTLAGGVQVELTATVHGAAHRYTFGAGDPIVVIDLGHTYGSNEVNAADLAIDGATVTGFQNLSGSYSGRYGGLQAHFIATFDPAPIAVGTWSDPDLPIEGATTASGTASGAWLQFPPGVVEVRVALSYVDLDGARANLDAELTGRSFDDLRAAAETAWRDELGNVRIRGGTEEQRRIFTTALFHAYQMPARFSDVDGRYRGIDGQVHTAGFDYYTDFSLWDTFRTLHPWLILARPERETDMARSLVQMAEDGGAYDRWPLGHGYTGGMVGSPQDQVLAETWLKGLQGFDADTAWSYAVANATGPTPPESRSGIEGYAQRGWVASDEAGGSVALTLEYAWNDAALADWGEAMGKPEVATLRTQADGWKNLWDPAQGFLVGRSTAGAYGTVDPEAWEDDYVEGDAWQYLWMVPQDVQGLIDVEHGGDRAAFLDRVDQFWADTYAAPDTAFPDPYYWHGNEPDLHDAYLGSLAGAPERSAAPIRWVRDHRYALSPAGLDGNDDGGTLSAWYLWSAMGLYPVAGTDRYAIGSPCFERVEVDTQGGTVVMRAVADAPWPDSILHHADLLDGDLVLPMGEP